MLAEMEPAEFTELMAAQVADPGDGWRQTAQVSELLYMIYQVVAMAASGGEVRPDDRNRDDFLPQWQLNEAAEELAEPTEELAPSVVDELQEYLRQN